MLMNCDLHKYIIIISYHMMKIHTYLCNRFRMLVMVHIQ